MDKSTIIQLVVCLGGIGSIVAGILYFLSFDSYMKDTDRRVEESEEKSLKTKNSIDFKKNHMALQEAVVGCGRF